jgi:hypothetical protein
VAKADANLALANAEAAESICRPFLHDEACVEDLIWVWAYALGLVWIDNEEAFRAVVARLLDYCQRFPNSQHVAMALANLFRIRLEALNLLGDSEDVDARRTALFMQAEALAKQQPDFADTRWCRAIASARVAEAWVGDDQRGLRLGAMARGVDAFAEPFPDHYGLQLARLTICRLVADYESRHGVSPGEAERIARRITGAAERFRSDENVAANVASAWESAAFGWRRDTREWRSCERALRRLESWVAEVRSGCDGEWSVVSAWDSLLRVHLKRPDHEAFARLEAQALDRTARALAAYPDDPGLAEIIGSVFANIAANRSALRTGRPAIGEMAERLKALSSRFPGSQSLAKNAAFAAKCFDSAKSGMAPAAET